MVPSRPWPELLLIACVGCGWLPPDSPPQRPEPIDADLAQLVHVWKIEAHVFATGTEMSESDAGALHGRTVAIEPAGYTSPWHGSCDDAGRQRRARVLADVAGELDVPAIGRAAATKFGLAEALVEYRLGCHGSSRIPPLTIYIAGTSAMTCFGGVCYLLRR